MYAWIKKSNVKYEIYFNRLHKGVPVSNEHRQDPADRWLHDSCAPDVHILCEIVLAEKGDLVSGQRPLPRKLASEDTRAAPCEAVPVPEIDAHCERPYGTAAPWHAFTRWRVKPPR